MSDYSYTIRRVDPVNQILGIKYSLDGQPDYLKNVRTNDFSRANVDQLVQVYAAEARLFWERVEEVGNQETEVSVGEGAPINPIVTIVEEEPIYNDDLQTIEQIETFDSDTNTRTYSWVINEKPLEEKLQWKLGEIALARFHKEAEGLVWFDAENTQVIYLDTSIDSQNRFSAARLAAESGERQDGGVWKCADVTSGTPQVIFRPTDNATIALWSGMVHDYVQSCFEAESVSNQKVLQAYGNDSEETMLAVSFEEEFNNL